MVTLPEFQQCEDCTHLSCGYLFVHYLEVGEDCEGDCPDADELCEMYPQGWIDADDEYL